MDEERLLNRLLFGELNMKRPCHGAKKRWRDVLKVNLQRREREKRKGEEEKKRVPGQEGVVSSVFRWCRENFNIQAMEHLLS